MEQDNKIKVAIVDDHRIVRDGLLSLLEQCDFIEICGQAGDAAAFNGLLATKKPDVVLMDISLPDESGIEITRQLTASGNPARVIILSMHVSEEFVLEAVQAGAKGYLPKNTSKDELLEALQTVADGGEYFNRSISNMLIRKMTRTQEADSHGLELLSKREIEILTLYAEGFSNQEIADKLFISHRTVESHKSHIMQKLFLKNQTDMLKFAIKHKLIEV
jgi:DNA-binding NarL/FixJ family response regulator